VTLSIAGRGQYERELRELSDKLKLSDSVRFLGHVDRTALQGEYAKSSLVIMPSVWPESFGLVGIEAMSVGRPVIATDIGGTSDWLIDHENGFAVSPKNPEAIAISVVQFFTDDGLRSAMSLNARKTSEHFSFDVHTDDLLTLYKTIIDNSGKKGELA
jgi:glycosyltransferase involved in cell wall biosynthesis